MGLLATGTSCLALVWVMGRRRVPAPPLRMRPFTCGSARSRRTILLLRVADPFASVWSRARMPPSGDASVRGAPLSPERSEGVEDVDDEDQRVGAADPGAGLARAAVALVRREDQEDLRTDRLADQAPVPPGQHLAGPDRERRRLAP